MRETTAYQFRQHLRDEVAQCITNHDVLRVIQRQGENFVVLGEADWRAIEETLYLNRIPGLADSILAAAKEPLEDGTALEDLEW